jgi:N4-gp56 family major capsid protein
MSQTTVPAGSALARKLYSVALFAQTQKAPGFSKNLTGPAPKTADAESKMKGQTAPDMPIVRVTDLSKTAGDTISVDAFNLFGGKPLVGDTNAEGRGESLSSSSMDIKIDLMTKVVDAGGKMAQQRTVHDLRSIGMAQMVSYWSRFDDQSSLVHLAGARGFQTGNDWIVPLASDTDFSGIMVNTVKAPTYDRHFVCDGTALEQGGVNMTDGSAVTGDALTLAHIDAMRAIIDEMSFPLQPVKIADDPAAADEPMYVLYVSPRQWAQLLTETSGIRSFQQNAWNRASYGSKHPLFKGEVGMWNGILVKKMQRAIRFMDNQGYQYQTAANWALGNETETAGTTTITGDPTTHGIDRAILLGGQALANVYGRNKTSDYYFSWYERPYNFERSMEIAGDVMGGKAKIRFQYDVNGVATYSDNGVIAIDSVVAL